MHGLRIPPPLMANGNTERQFPGLKHATARPGRVRTLFRRVNLNLVLKPSDRAVRIDDQGRRHEPTRNNAFGPEHDRDLRLPGRNRDHGPSAFQKLGIGGSDAPTNRPISRDEALRKTHDLRPLGGAFRDGPLGQRD